MRQGETPLTRWPAGTYQRARASVPSLPRPPPCPALPRKGKWWEMVGNDWEMVEGAGYGLTGDVERDNRSSLTARQGSQGLISGG